MRFLRTQLGCHFVFDVIEPDKNRLADLQNAQVRDTPSTSHRIVQPRQKQNESLPEILSFSNSLWKKTGPRQRWWTRLGGAAPGVWTHLGRVAPESGALRSLLQHHVAPVHVGKRELPRLPFRTETCAETCATRKNCSGRYWCSS